MQHVGCKGEEVEALLRRCRRFGGRRPGGQLIAGGGVERVLYLRGPSTQQEVQDVAAQATLSNRGPLRSIGEGALAVSSSQGEASSASCTCGDQARRRGHRASLAQLERYQASGDAILLVSSWVPVVGLMLWRGTENIQCFQGGKQETGSQEQGIDGGRASCAGLQQMCGNASSGSSHQLVAMHQTKLFNKSLS